MPQGGIDPGEPSTTPDRAPSFRIVLENEYTWGAVGAPDGHVYFGTYPNAYFGDYDIAAGECSLPPGDAFRYRCFCISVESGDRPRELLRELVVVRRDVARSLLDE